MAASLFHAHRGCDGTGDCQTCGRVCARRERARGTGVRIAFVFDDMSQETNGTTMTAVRYADALRAMGHEVRMVAYGAHGPDAYPVGRCHYPIVDAFAGSQGFVFGKPDEQVFARAFAGVDVVHLFLPFKLEQAALAFARERRIPVSAAYHLQPENVTFGANLAWLAPLAPAIYAHFRRVLYDRVRHVHCPSEFMAARLTRFGYASQLHAISNGVSADFTPGAPTRPFSDGLFHVLTVGRLAREKCQRTLVEAAALSRHADAIQVHVAGAGPLEGRLRRLGERLPHPPDIAFHDRASLVELIRACDLYTHCSVVDSEAISCIEALSCGCVPVIARSSLSATAQFALDERSLFPARDARALAERIDWWIEHPRERAQASRAYAKAGEAYRVEACAARFLEMERAAVADDIAAGDALPPQERGR